MCQIQTQFKLQITQLSVHFCYNITLQVVYFLYNIIKLNVNHTLNMEKEQIKIKSCSLYIFYLKSRFLVTKKDLNSYYLKVINKRNNKKNKIAHEI